ncbi:MAG TPA: GNAT family N-acetyltransferase [Phycisphaerales bacterium]|nr:GNAT family N-acetyltransferase [Phycisphaerales bacterium]
METPGRPCLVRLARREDLASIFAIYDEQVLHGVATFDTECKSGSEREEWFAKHAPERHPVIVAVDGGSGGEVAGWASLSAWSERCAYARAAEVSVYVRGDRRGGGVGTLLMGELIARARANGLGVLLARIVAGNPASVRLHERFGFGTIGVMRRVGEKFGRVLDVHLMDLQLDGVENGEWKMESGGRKS